MKKIHKQAIALGGTLLLAALAGLASTSHLLFIIITSSLISLLSAFLLVCLLNRIKHHRHGEATPVDAGHLLKLQEQANERLQKINAALETSEEKLSVTLNSIGDAVIAVDADGRVTLLNPLAERLTGWTQAQATGLQADEIFHIINQETRQPATIPVKEALAHGTKQGLANHTILIARDGSECSIADSCAPIRGRDGRIVGAVLVFRDVTGEYATKKAVSDLQYYTRSLIESSVDALMTTDPAGVITDANNQMEALTGRTRDELIGTPFKNHFTDPQRAEAGIHLVLEKKKVSDYELTARDRDGRETRVSYNAATFHDREGRLMGVIAAARDITEREHLYQLLQERNLDLESARSLAEKANLAKSDFLSSMSHELRTPLNAILGFAQLMESGTPAPMPAQKRNLDQILKAGWFLLDLINEILDLALIESGKVTVSREPVSLVELMLECRTMIEPQAQLRGISMTFPRFDKPCYVNADRTRVKQVLINLLFNAIKYNRAAGSVTVECNPGLNDSIRISIRDTGAGLSAEKLLHLFEPFNRLGKEASAEEGTGIGLVVTKRLIQLMGGTIGVDSTVGTGSVFWIELGKADAPQLSAHNAERTALLLVAPGAPVRTLLYVEDNPANLELVEQLVARRPDLRLLSATDGELGVEFARLYQPDVILMDINLPGISGTDAMQILRLDLLTSHIPIIALSANAMPRDIERALNAGFFNYVTKPIKVDQFMDTLDAALDLAKTAPRRTADRETA